MPHARFTQPSVFHAANLLARRYQTHAEFDNLMLQFGVENSINQGSLQHKANDLIRFVDAHPDHETPDGREIADAIVEEAVAAGHWASEDEKLNRALNRDGYVIAESGNEGLVLQAMMPPVADLATASDEVHVLLGALGMQTAKGHLDQAIDNHGRGHWAAANAQLRSFVEDMFNEIARSLAPTEARGRNSESLRQLLAQISPPFLSSDLGEWSPDGKNFVNGLFKRMHGHGSHPGLSEEDDCTFRLHLVLVAARHYLRRTRQRISTLSR